MIILLKKERKQNKTNRFGAKPTQTTPPPSRGTFVKYIDKVYRYIREDGERERDWESGLLPEADAKMHPTMQISQPDGFVRAMHVW